MALHDITGSVCTLASHGPAATGEGAVELGRSCCASRGAQGVPKAQGAFLSLMLSMRSGHLILLDLEVLHFNFDLLFEFPFI